jgi:YbbR domain-containing protein
MTRIAGALTRHMSWKLGALMLAILLWVATVGEPELVTTHTVPILYKDLKPGLLIGYDAADTVRVELRGPRSKLGPASLADLAIMLDVSDVDGTTQRTFTLSGADFHLPPGVAFLRAVPSQLRVAIARQVAKDVPVEIQIGAKPGAGYRIVAQDVSPATVRITGPENRLAVITSAQTDVLDLSGITANTAKNVNVFLADTHVWLESSPLVTVRVNIEKDTSVK